MHKAIIVISLMVFIAGCSFTHTTAKVNYATFALKRHKKIRDKKKDLVASVTVPGNVAKAQTVVRRAARQLNLTEEEPGKREDHFLFFTNKETKHGLRLGKKSLGFGTNESADNNIGAFFYPVEEYNVTTILFTEEKYNAFAESLRDEMVRVVGQIAPN